MNNQDREIALTHYLEGVSSDSWQTPEFINEAQDLKQILSDLKMLPKETVGSDIDAKIEAFIEQNSMPRSIKVRQLWPYLTIAACILLLVLLFPVKNTFKGQYNALASNPEKLNFIYLLNEEKLQISDINWLQTELKSETNPNIKVTIIDVLTDYQSRLDKEFFYALNDESIPSVQMALLNILENSSHIDFSEELEKITNREDLDISVRQKAQKIIFNQ